MTMTDPIADYIIRIKNASRAKHKKVDIPLSKIKLEITKILQKEKFIQGYTSIDDGKQGILRIYLKYDDNNENIITNIKRVSKPGLRKYVKKKEIPRVMNNLGIAILTTPLGVLSNKEARKKGVGGEVICYVW
ncbi:30S ribosomal protein S8 [candidate division KSB1 bacterium]|nr:MAG: 30S ribosomal protein S8 [candidate division KSB1 bacterium]